VSSKEEGSARIGDVVFEYVRPVEGGDDTLAVGDDLAL
jgi:hypothetical protein